MTTSANQQNPTPPTAANRLRQPVRRAVLAVAASGLLLGGATAAFAGDTGPTSNTIAASPSNATPASPTAGADRPAPRPRQPHLDGTVTATSAEAVTITDHDGFTRTIQVTPATSYEPGLTAPLAIGTHVHAVGTVDADRTSLDATTITTTPAKPGPQAGGPKKPHPQADGPHRRDANPAPAGPKASNPNTDPTTPTSSPSTGS